MINIISTIIAVKADRRAVTALEYGILAGMIVATIAVGFSGLANALSNQFSTIANGL